MSGCFTKGQAVNGLTFVIINRFNGLPITSGTVNGYVTIDGGTQQTLTNSPVHEGNGQWSVDITGTEMNGDIIGLLFTHVDGINTELTIPTTEEVAESSASSEDIDIVSAANNPLRMRTDEGSIEERSIDELIKADRYNKSSDASKVPWGMRIARSQPGGPNGRN